MRALFPSLKTKLADFWRSDQGAGTVDGLFWTLSSLAVASFAIDGSHAWRSQTQLQTAADAAALAGAAYADKGPDLAVKMALRVAAMNLGGDTSVLRSEDVTLGTFDTATGFAQAADLTNFDAVQVDVQRLASRGTELRTLVMGLIGKNSWDMSTRAVAVHRSGHAIAFPDCEHGLLASHTGVVLDGSDVIEKDVCVHGEQRLITGSGSLFDASVTLSAPDVNRMLIGGFGPSGLSLDDITVPRSIPKTALNEAKELYKSLVSTFLQDVRPATVTEAEWTQKFGFPIFDTGATVSVVPSVGRWVVDDTLLMRNTIYAHQGDVYIPAGSDLSNVAILATGTVLHTSLTTAPTDGPRVTPQDDALVAATVGGIKGDPVLVNTQSWVHYSDTLVIGAQLDLTGNTRIGPPDICQANDYSAYFLSAGDFSLGSDGANVPVQGLFGFALDGTITTDGGMFGAGVYLESTGIQQHSRGIDIVGCDAALNTVIQAPFQTHQIVQASRLVF
ncbi:MAG: pilus assembly protein TadG-related protein [Pseudomonadota bacterium]